MTASRICVVLGATIALAACHREQPPTATGGGPRAQVDVQNAIGLIALAKCDQAMRCGRIGPTEKFTSRDQCETATEGTIGDDLRVEDCRAGINDGALKGCMSELQNESCERPSEKISRASCNVDRICLR